MKYLYSIYFLTLSILLVFLSSVSLSSLDQVKCRQLLIDVDTEEELFFLNADMVEELLLEKLDSIVGKTYEDINIFLLEEFIEEHPNIAKADLYLTIDGNICIEVKQRRPIARAFEEGQSYYLDQQLNAFPLSEIYSARVIQVYWSEMTESRKSFLNKVIGFIQSDDFLSAQITAIEFDEANHMIVYPRVGDHKIILGDVGNLDKKFNKLKLFYRQGIGKVGWDRYSQINLRFDKQVVCTKR